MTWFEIVYNLKKRTKVVLTKKETIVKYFLAGYLNENDGLKCVNQALKNEGLYVTITNNDNFIEITPIKPTINKSFQVGGDHYSKHKIQPFDIIDEYDLNFYEGNCLKYLLRHKDKNGVEDLKKARHYLDVMIGDNNANN